LIDPLSLQVGDIILVKLEDATGNEQQGTRPAVIMAIHIQTKLFFVIPLTSTDVSRFPFSLFIKATSNNGLSNNSYAMTYQMRTIASERIIKKYGKLEQSIMDILKEQMKNYLKLCSIKN